MLSEHVRITRIKTTSGTFHVDQIKSVTWNRGCHEEWDGWFHSKTVPDREATVTVELKTGDSVQYTVSCPILSEQSNG